MTEELNGQPENPTPEPPVTEPEKPWYDSFTDESLKTNPTIQKYKNPEELAKGLINVNKLIGQKGVIKPPDDAPQELWDKYYNDLGRPEKPDDYELPKIDIPDELTPEADINWLKQTAYELGMTKNQVSKLFEKYGERLKDSFQKYNDAETKRIQELEQAEIQKRNDSETKLRADWGDKYDEMNNIAVNTINRFVSKEDIEFISKEFGIRPEIKRVFANIGKQISSDTLGGKQINNLNLSKSDILNKISTIRSDLKHPFNDANHPKHKDALNEMNELYRLSV